MKKDTSKIWIGMLSVLMIAPIRHIIQTLSLGSTVQSGRDSPSVRADPSGGYLWVMRSY